MLTLTGVERSYASAIGQTMENLTVQAEVGAAMESMLGDLEAWEWANKEEVLKKELEHARAQIQALKQSERDLLEREKLAAARLEENKASARDVRGKFVEELWGLAREFRIREQEQVKADQLSKKLTRLEGVETELREAERKLLQMQTAQEAAAAAGNTGAERGGSSTGPASPISTGGPSATDLGPGPDAPPGVDGVARSGGGDGSPAGSTAGAAAAPAAAEHCLLLDLEKKPLLKVFVFLNATEVLRAAQVCRPMFRKVDLMFGIGSQAVSAAPTAAAPAPAPAPSPAASAAAAAAALDSSAGGGGRSRAGSTTSTSSASAAAASGNRLGQRALGALGVVASRMEAVTAGASSGFGSLAAAANFTGGGSDLGGAGGGGGGMSPELMDDLSKRLTTVEMKGIIQLTERGRRMEARASTLQAEKEDLFARLQGTESVKEFLVGKLKETEAALKRSLDEKGLTLRQSASDQEVISFLDSRTQEMERVARETMDKAMAYQNELEQQKAACQKQTKVLEDMLRFEKQRGEAEEAASKAQKRLLVNEVKKLRTANLALKAECDDLRQQLKDLRTSVSQLGR